MSFRQEVEECTLAAIQGTLYTVALENIDEENTLDVFEEMLDASLIYYEDIVKWWIDEDYPDAEDHNGGTILGQMTQALVEIAHSYYYDTFSEQLDRVKSEV